MRNGAFIKIFKKSFYDYCKNPIIIAPGFSLLIFFIVFSKLSVKINYGLQNTPALTLWLIFFSIISLLVISLILSGLIGMTSDIMKKKDGIKSFLYNCRKFWFGNFIIILIIILAFNIIRYVAHNLAFFLGRSLNLEVDIAAALFFLLYFGGILSSLIFLTFANISLIVYKKSILESMRKSFYIVKKNYIETLLILILFFVVNEILIRFIPSYGIELINAIFIVPYYALILTRFVIESEGIK